MTPGLTFAEFKKQMSECSIMVQSPYINKALAPQSIVIRTSTGDHGLCAIHRDGSMLIFDMGQELKDTP